MANNTQLAWRAPGWLRIIPGLAGFLLILVGLAGYYVQDEVARDARPTPAEISVRMSQLCSGARAHAEVVRCSLDASRQIVEDRIELFAAQRSAQDFTISFVELMSSIGALILSGIAVALLIDTLKQTAKATNAAEVAARAGEVTVEEMRKQFVAERRAWLSIEFEAPSVRLEGKDARCVAHVTVVNVGQSPALGAEVFVAHWGARADETELGAILTGNPRAPDTPGVTVFPGQAWKQRLPFTWHRATDEYGPKFTYAHGWVSYRMGGVETVHYTPFIYRMQFEIADGPRVEGIDAGPHRLLLSPT